MIRGNPRGVGASILFSKSSIPMPSTMVSSASPDFFRSINPSHGILGRRRRLKRNCRSRRRVFAVRTE